MQLGSAHPSCPSAQVHRVLLPGYSGSQTTPTSAAEARKDGSVGISPMRTAVARATMEFGIIVVCNTLLDTIVRLPVCSSYNERSSVCLSEVLL